MTRPMLTIEKAKARVDRAKRHAELDMLIACTYWNERRHKGCSVGCDAFDIAGVAGVRNPHATVAAHDGTPEWLERLRDIVFEGLPKEKQSWWHVELAVSLLEAVQRGAVDFEKARHLIAIRRLDRVAKIVAALPDADYKHDVLAAVDQVKRCHAAEIAGDTCDWSAARSASRSASSAAADAWDAASSSAVEAWAALAAWSVSELSASAAAGASAADAASSAALAALAASESSSSARLAAYIAEAEDVIDVIRSLQTC